MNRYRGRYTEEEIEALIEGYEELRYLKYKPYVLVRLLDLDTAIHKLPPKEYQAVLLCGLIGLSTRWAGEVMGVSKDTIHRRYKHGLRRLHQILNGQIYTVQPQ